MPYGAVTGEFDGIQITDWLVHDRIYREARSWPEYVVDFLAKSGARYEAHVHDLHGRSRMVYVDMIQHLKQRVETKTKVTLDFAAREPWGMFLVTFTDAHGAGHVLWYLHDPSRPQHDAALTAEMGDPLKAIYAAIDSALRRLVSAVGKDVTVIVFSGIGIGPNYSDNFLLGEFLRTREFGAHPPQRSVDWAWRTYRRVMPLAGRNLLLGLAARTDERLVARDRSRRRYFAILHNEISGAIRINLKGREPDGKVEPGAEYERLCDELAHDLVRVVNADTGAPAVKEVVRVKANYFGPFVDVLPDLLVVWTKAEPLTAISADGVGLVRANYSGNRTGDHTSNIFCAAHGPGIVARQLNARPELVEFAPTMATLLGVGLAEWDGVQIGAFIGSH